jgi:hypothetical protein
VHGIEARRSRHAEQRQAADQEGDGDEGDAIEQAAEPVEIGGPGAAVHIADHQQHDRDRQAEVDRQQQAPCTPAGCRVNRPMTIRLVWLTTAKAIRRRRFACRKASTAA